MINVDINDRELFRHIARVQRGIALASNETVKDLAEVGKQHARSIAPYRTGRLAKFIVKRTKETPKGVTAQVQAQNPTRNPPSDYRNPGREAKYPNGKFNLVRWMHQTGGRGHIKTGDPRFMYTTRRFMNAIKPGVATGKFKNINLR